MLRLFLITLLLLFPAYAHAQNPVEEANKDTQESTEEESKGHLYAPDYCEFNITFPEEPYIEQRCEGNKGQQCYDMASFTRVHDMAATVKFRVICNPVDPSVKDAYSGDVMQATLRAMTKNTLVKTHNTAFRKGKNYKQASLVGEGRVGNTDMIYIGQLWIGKKSAFTLEAELIGAAHESADELFSKILRSVGPFSKDSGTE